MEDKISIRGRTARNMVRLANHLPVFGNMMQNGEVRKRLSERERPWECPEHLLLERLELSSCTMELLRKKDRDAAGVILQLHGGGYYGRLNNTYRYMAGLYNELSRGFDVLSVDYRTAPEHPYPAALYDALEAYEWILKRDYKTVIVAGDSAGGGLSLALGLYLRDHDMPMPAGIITMSAWTDLTRSGESYQENFEVDPIFGGTRDTLVYKDWYYQERDPQDPYISPVNGDYRGFPPMLMQVGEYEMLLSDTLTVAEKAAAAGVSVKQHTYMGMFHVFQMGLLLYPEAKNAWIEVGHFIRKVSRRQIQTGRTEDGNVSDQALS